MNHDQAIAALARYLTDPVAKRELTLEAIERGGLRAFIKCAWHVLEPGIRLVWGWHLDAICEHLEAVTEGQIRRLLINVPPGTMKSLAVSVFWPCWEWGPRKLPHLRTVAASYGAHLSQRDNLKCRRLIVSPWYQGLWGGHVVLTGDQNAKTKFENTATGFRMSTSVGGVGTGERGDRFIIDDPHNVKDANSDLKRAEALLWFRETVPTRVNDLRTSAFVVIMQRVHEEDISGEILANEMGYEHLMLPMRFEPERKCVIEVTGFEDPRTEEGELLWPEKFPEEEVQRLERDLGSYAVAGQLQQRPAPREGAMFKRSWFPVVKAAPIKGTRARRWDLAASENGDADYTVGVKMCRGDDGIYYIENMVRFQGSPAEVERMVKTVASQDGYSVAIGIPQDPGQAGKAVVSYYTRQLAGYVIKPEREDARLGSKIQRVEGFAAQCEAGNVRLVEGPWNEEFLDEVCTFPASKHDDIVDAVGGAFRMVALNQTDGMIHYLRQEIERIEEGEDKVEVEGHVPLHGRTHSRPASFIPKF